MATILEGLNAISQAVGGTGGAESNLEALNQISGALGGSADATENAEAIANIAENASGGGGSSDFTTATVTVTMPNSNVHFFGVQSGAMTVVDGFAITTAPFGDMLVATIGSEKNTPMAWQVVMFGGRASLN